jgi:hypothetical protein
MINFQTFGSFEDNWIPCEFTNHATGLNVELEPLCKQIEKIDYEHTIFQALVNEGKHINVSKIFIF